MKSLTFDDHCSSCGKLMADTEGTLATPSTCLCDDCAFKRSRRHVSGPGQDRVIPLPKPIKESSIMSVKSYVTNFIEGVFGKFRRNPSTGELECTGLALTDTGDSRDNSGGKIAALVQESDEENAPIKVASQFTRMGDGEIERGT